jgi:hypothetical protein
VADSSFSFFTTCKKGFGCIWIIFIKGPEGRELIPPLSEMYKYLGIQQQGHHLQTILDSITN